MENTNIREFSVNSFHEHLIQGTAAKYIAECMGRGEIEYATNYLHMLLTAVEDDENSKIILGKMANMIPTVKEDELDSLLKLNSVGK